jgi:hypothetical protein
VQSLRIWGRYRKTERAEELWAAPFALALVLAATGIKMLMG